MKTQKAKLVFIAETNTEEIKSFFELDSDVQRYIYYKGNTPGGLRLVVTESDKFICYKRESCSIKISGTKFYMRATEEHVAIFSKLDGKLIKTVGNNWRNVIIDCCFGMREKNTVVDNPQIRAFDILIGFNTYQFPKSIYSMIFAGKLTSTKDVLRAYIKTSYKYNIDNAGLWLKYANEHSCRTQCFRNVFRIASVVNPNAYVKYMVDNNYVYLQNDLYDLIEQGLILNRKVNLNWSQKHIDDLHGKWTKDIMKLELKSKSTKPLEYVNTELLNDNSIKLLATIEEVYEHATLQGHCLFTNYYINIANKQYMAFQISYEDKLYTIGVSLYNNTATIDQIRGKYNATAPAEVHAVAKYDLEKDCTKEFIRINTKIPIKAVVNVPVDEDVLPF